jgi:tripartite-type tricarboxylate transporter receptor subunit TctC
MSGRLLAALIVALLCSLPATLRAAADYPARPATTPKDIVDRLSAELHKLADSPDVRQHVHTEGGDTVSSTADEYARDIAAEDAKWGGLVRKLGLKVE